MNILTWGRMFTLGLIPFWVLSVTGACSAEDRSAHAASITSSNQRPNFVVVLADDLGYGDIACYGHEVIQTPHLDRFATDSLKLTSCYAAHPNCSPSRTGMMTGRTPVLVGIHNWIPMLSPMHVRKREIAVSTLLRQAGYATCLVGYSSSNSSQLVGV